MSSPSPVVLHRYFAGIAENTFQSQLGVADPPLIDYIADLLARFIRSETIFRIRSLAGRPLREVGEMLTEAQSRVGDARREVHRHIGDYTLFWTGVFPEAVDHLRSGSRDQMVDYRTEGKRSYWIASTIRSDANADAPAELLERLSQQFELCAYGLREVRRVWEERDGEAPGRTFFIC